MTLRNSSSLVSRSIDSWHGDDVDPVHTTTLFKNGTSFLLIVDPFLFNVRSTQVY